MGRIQAGIAKVIGFALVVLSVPAFAQQSAQEQKPAAPNALSKPGTGPWKEVAEGIWKVHISRFPNAPGQPKNPEFAVVRLTAERYEEFKKNRKDFLNDHKIFARKVNKQELCGAATPQTQATGEAYWYILLPHWPASSVACQAYAEWSEPAISK
jgi:hypothetical protein